MSPCLSKAETISDLGVSEFKDIVQDQDGPIFSSKKPNNSLKVNSSPREHSWASFNCWVAHHCVEGVRRRESESCSMARSPFCSNAAPYNVDKALINGLAFMPALDKSEKNLLSEVLRVSSSKLSSAGGSDGSLSEAHRLFIGHAYEFISKK